ncbi:helix-turn-helix domain-containing protein [Quadrisphaera sp. DSM 44207]|uniref:helix-turn-helix domain-containing protein n=1 Tax=Quadrisphaera sp. DSM 44207 TaxID=1881057 RepID=UPI00088D764A|nr:helix-turn-helix transcriptional regulator [Quadrisphaera sp. DSM 44207]SDQ33579.1 Helix-turn-helix domain-containing protein [Quadrisphaera sp. DSM 44207]
MVLLRREIGDVLRAARQQQGRTLREVSGAARVSLGYLSEVERGQKEASSELLSSICDALDVPMSTVLREVSDRVAAVEEPARLLPGTGELEAALERDGVDAATAATAATAVEPVTIEAPRLERKALVSAA